MKTELSLLLTCLLFAGCLVPGAPHTYHYAPKNQVHDMVSLVSYPRHVEYRVNTNSKPDSLFVLNPLHNEFKRMMPDTLSTSVYYSRQRESNSNVSKAEKNQQLITKKYNGGLVSYDTAMVVTKIKN